MGAEWDGDQSPVVQGWSFYQRYINFIGVQPQKAYNTICLDLFFQKNLTAGTKFEVSHAKCAGGSNKIITSVTRDTKTEYTVQNEPLIGPRGFTNWCGNYI